MIKTTAKEMKLPLINGMSEKIPERNFTSLEKVRFLRDKITNPLQVTTESASSTIFNEDFNLFVKTFDALISKMESIGQNETLSSSAEDLSFMQSLTLNRGDARQSRFKRNNSLTKHACLEDQISRLTKIFIEKIEDENLNQPLLNIYHERGVYENLYHIGTIGEYIWHNHKNREESPIGPIMMRSAVIGLGCSSVSVAFFSLVVFLELNNQWATAFSTALLGSATAYMSGLLYGITNDIFATRLNLPYFLLGHQAPQYSLFISNDPLVQAIGWGIIAAESIAKIASVIFGIAIFAALAASSPVRTFILPLMSVAVLLFALCANAYANYSVAQYLKNGVSMSMFPEDLKHALRAELALAANDERIPLEKIDFDNSCIRQQLTSRGALNNYQLDGLALMSSSNKDKAGWLANSDRNMMGYAGTPLIAIASLVLMLSLERDPNFLLSTTLPIVAACIEIAALGVALTYVLVNQERQIDNRYRLFKYDHISKEPDKLYIKSEITATMEA